MRATHVTLATVSVAVPATATAMTVPGASASAQTVGNPPALHVAPRDVHFGSTVDVSGVAPADAGGTIELQMQPRGSLDWHVVSSTSVAGDGSFRFRMAPRGSGTVRAVESTPGAVSADEVTAGDATGAPTASSPTARVTVMARFSLPRRQFAVLGGQPVRVSGHLLPAAGGRAVRLQGRTPQGWRTLATTRTGPAGGFSVRFAPGAATGQRLRVLFAGDAADGRAVGSAGTVSVFTPEVASWYDDAGTTGCGFHAGLGVANKTLPCGTKVTIRWGGRTVVATVDDRGPYVAGRDFDLNQNTAAALGFAGVGTVWVSS